MHSVEVRKLPVWECSLAERMRPRKIGSVSRQKPRNTMIHCDFLSRVSRPIKRYGSLPQDMEVSLVYEEAMTRVQRRQLPAFIGALLHTFG